tara:strand:+ start:502 stop:702 length:201 start_codon:yes stop_codon:yes gene_type:complete
MERNCSLANISLVLAIMDPSGKATRVLSLTLGRGGTLYQEVTGELGEPSDLGTRSAKRMKRMRRML